MKDVRLTKNNWNITPRHGFVRRDHLSPAAGLFAVSQENKKTVLIHPNIDSEERLN
jgi:hypothetical protein